jgi:hypothetical protein
MKAYFLGLVLLTSLPVIAQTAPTEAAQPFKGATGLLFHTTDSASVAYKKVGQALLGSGYALAKSDKELGAISTAPRPAPRYNMLYSCNFFVKPTAKGSDVLVSGTFSLPGAAAVASFMAGDSPIVYKGGAASTNMICWQAMQQAAQAAYPSVAPAYVQLP